MQRNAEGHCNGVHLFLDMVEGYGSLEALDEQLLASIFFHIDPKDVASVRSVSRDWEKVVDGAQVREWMNSLNLEVHRSQIL